MIYHHNHPFVVSYLFIFKAVHIFSDIPSDYNPPWDVHLELMASAIFFLYGVIISLKLFPVQQSSKVQTNTWDECIGRSEFCVFNHRKDEGEELEGN